MRRMLRRQGASSGDDAGPANGDSGATPEAPAGPPSKAEAIGALKRLFAAMESKSWDEAANYVNFGKKPPADLAAAFEKLLKQEEISAGGIDILEQRGTFDYERVTCPGLKSGFDYDRLKVKYVFEASAGKLFIDDIELNQVNP